MSIIQIMKPSCEPVSLIEAKAYIRIDRNDDDELLLHLIEAARSAVENYTSRSLICQRWRYKFNGNSGIAMSDLEYVLGYRTRGFKGVELPRSPFIRLANKPKIIGASGQEMELDKYKMDTAGRSARMHFCEKTIDSFDYSCHIVVDFDAGYGESPADVPMAFRQAILMMVADLYDHPIGYNDNHNSLILSPSVRQIIRPYKNMRIS